MEKYTLTLRDRYDSNSIWAKNLLYKFSLNSQVTVNITNEFPHIPVKKHVKLIPFKINEKVFLIDEWDYGYPSTNLADYCVIPEYYLREKPTILKIQYHVSYKPSYDELYSKYGMLTYPFTMFPSQWFPLEYFKYNFDDKKYMFSFSGRRWKGRFRWLNEIIKMDNVYVCDQNDETNVYLDIMKNMRWGLCLQGKGAGGQNRREVEYSSLRLPLALNYKPTYAFDFVPNVDYIYLENPSDLYKLKDIDTKPFSERSYEIYQKYFSNQGIFNCFIEAYTNTLQGKKII